MRPVVCTGFDITDALRKYLEDGHNIDPQPVYVSLPDIDPDSDESGDDPELSEQMTRRTFVYSCRAHFCRLRMNAPAEDRKLLEIPYCESFVPSRFDAQVLRLTHPTAFDKRFPPDHSWHPRLFVPTGAYTLEQYRSGALASSQEEDVKAMQSFIECANRLLPDDAARERAGLKLEDLQYEIQPSWELSLPVYRKAEKEVGNVYRRV